MKKTNFSSFSRDYLYGKVPITNAKSSGSSQFGKKKTMAIKCSSKANADDLGLLDDL